MSLIAHWKLDGVPNDSAGSNDGIAYGNPTYIAGMRNQAMQFDGLTYIDAGTALNVSIPFSIMLWLKVDDRTTSWATIIDKGEAVEDFDSNFYLTLNSGLYQGLENQIYITVGSNDGFNFRSFVTDNALDITAWHHLAVVFEAVDNIRIYVDGVQWTGLYDGGGSVAAPNTRKLIIGAANTIPNEGFVGALDDVKVYNHAVTTAEINNDITQPAPCPSVGVSIGITV